LSYFLRSTITQHHFIVKIRHQTSIPQLRQAMSLIPHFEEACQMSFTPQREGTAFSLII